jgi:hypothetical protein
MRFYYYDNIDEKFYLSFILYFFNFIFFESKTFLHGDNIYVLISIKNPII